VPVISASATQRRALSFLRTIMQFFSCVQA
jgi:hypothetical protein